MKFWGPGTGVFGRGRWREARPGSCAAKAHGPRRILVIQFGQLGDSVLSLPALDLLRESFPEAELTLGCGMPAHELLDLWGRAERIVPLDRVAARDKNPLKAAWLICQFVSRVWKPRPDAVIVLHPNDEMNLVAYCTGAPRRTGFFVKPTLFSSLLTEPLEGAWRGTHASVSYLALVRKFCGLPEQVLSPPIPSLELAPMPERNGRVAIHVGGGRKSKRVTPESWLEVARALRAATGKDIAFISGPEEPHVAAELARAMEGASPLVNLTIEELASEVAKSGFFVGTDSGPGHMAAALKTPSLTLIEEHVASRYHTLGLQARHLCHSGGIARLAPKRIVDATLAHPHFPRQTVRA